MGAYKNFSAQQFEEIFDHIVDAKINEDSIKAFLLDLNSENLPTNAFLGAVASLRKRMKQVSAPANSIDVCGTGGDRLNTLNISTAVCFVVAAAGIPVAKHGNKAMSSLSGSADIFSELGVKILSDEKEIEKNLTEKKLCFLFAPFFHGALKNVANVRKNLGVPTIFNFLGPLLNPANTRLQLIGTSRHDVIPKMASVVAQNPQAKAYIVHGLDGMDEISLCTNSHLVRVENGKIFEEEIINPENLGFKKVTLEALRGADPKHNAHKLIAFLEGEKSAYRDIVVLNAAYALHLAGKSENIEICVELAQSAIDSGAALKILKDLQS